MLVTTAPQRTYLPTGYDAATVRGLCATGETAPTTG